jgi:hypothetical protein
MPSAISPAQLSRLGGPIYWPLDHAPEVLSLLREFAPTAPDDLGVVIVAQHAPPMPFLRRAGVPSAFLGSFLGRKPPAASGPGSPAAPPALRR